MSQLNFLGFDFGASSGRAMLGTFENGKMEIQEIHRFSNDPVMLCGRFVWDLPRLVYEMKQALLKLSRMNVKVSGIGIDTWGVDFGLLDKDGNLLGLPVLFAVRGFLLAFSIASFVRLFGGTGCLLALLVFGVGGAFSVPALFVLGVQSFMTARTLAGRVWGESKAAPLYGRAYWLRCGGCAAALCVCMLLDGFAVPALVSGLAGTLLAG